MLLLFIYFSTRWSIYLFFRCLLHVTQKWQEDVELVELGVEVGVEVVVVVVVVVGVVVGHAVPDHCRFHSKH